MPKTPLDDLLKESGYELETLEETVKSRYGRVPEGAIREECLSYEGSFYYVWLLGMGEAGMRLFGTYEEADITRQYRGITPKNAIPVVSQQEVNDQIRYIIGGSPPSLVTLKEIAEVIEPDPLADIILNMKGSTLWEN